MKRQSDEPQDPARSHKTVDCFAVSPRWKQSRETHKPLEKPHFLWVYFIRCADGPIKIGLAGDVGTRLRVLQVGNHRPLDVHAQHVYDATLAKRIERLLHNRLAAHLLGGEWFEPHQDVLRAAVDPALFVSSALSSQETARERYPEMLA